MKLKIHNSLINFILLLVLLCGIGIFSCTKDANPIDISDNNLKLEETNEIQRISTQSPKVKDGTLVFQNIDHLLDYYNEMEKIYDKNIAEFDKLSLHLGIESVRKTLIMPHGKDAKRKPFIGDPIMSALLNTDYRLMICNTIITQINDNYLFLSRVGDPQALKEISVKTFEGLIVDWSKFESKILLLNIKDFKKLFQIDLCAAAPDLPPGPPPPPGPVVTECICTIAGEIDENCNVRIVGGCQDANDFYANYLPVNITISGAVQTGCLTQTLSTSDRFDDTFTLCDDTKFEIKIEPVDCLIEETWSIPAQRCDTKFGNIWEEWANGPIKLEAWTSYYTAWGSRKHKAETRSWVWDGFAYERNDVDEIAVTINARTVNDWNCEENSFEVDSDSCQNCNTEDVRVNNGLNHAIAHCTGDVWGEYFARLGNDIIDESQSIGFDVCYCD